MRFKNLFKHFRNPLSAYINNILRGVLIIKVDPGGEQVVHVDVAGHGSGTGLSESKTQSLAMSSLVTDSLPGTSPQVSNDRWPASEVTLGTALVKEALGDAVSLHGLRVHAGAVHGPQLYHGLGHTLIIS